MPAPTNSRTGASSVTDTAGSPDGGHRRLGHGRRLRSGTAPHGRPDAAVLAREAVISFLNDASKATADREAIRAGVAATDGGASVTAGPALETVPRDAVSAANNVAAPQATGSMGWGAAAIGAATLDRIEAAAAKVDADIAVALRAYADLQAGAGAAAEAAVHAAQSAMASAGVATEAERQVRISLRQVRQYVVVTVVLVAIVLLVVAVITTAVR
jgi:hypothetical protein